MTDKNRLVFKINRILSSFYLFFLPEGLGVGKRRDGSGRTIKIQVKTVRQAIHVYQGVHQPLLIIHPAG